LKIKFPTRSNRELWQAWQEILARLRDAILATEYAQFNATSLDGGIVDEAFLEWGVTRDIAGGAQLYGRSLRHDA
jgi:hypothetical protein